MKVYIAGPMTGHQNYNFDAFHTAAAKLREQGIEVDNPAEHFGGDQSLHWTEYMRTDVQSILSVDEVRVLPGWRNSKGACLETTIAAGIGVPIKTLDGEPIDVRLERDGPGSLRLRELGG